MGYLKLWESLLDCPKAHRLSDLAFRVWMKTLLTALRNGGRNGELPSRETLEFRLRMKWEDIEPAIKEMHQCKLLDPCPDNPIGGIPWQIHDWDHWQKPKDPKSAERQARWRERQALRNASHNGVSDESRNGSHNGVECKKDRMKKNTPHKPPKGGGVSSFVLPEWIPHKDWDDWIANRKRKPTLRALELAVENLSKLRDAGNDPGEVLRRSVMGGWTGLFEVPKKATAKGENAGKTAVQQRPEETRIPLKPRYIPEGPEGDVLREMWGIAKREATG